MGHIYNGYNLKDTYNILIQLAANPMMAMPDRKDSTSNNFQEENGIDIDLTAVYFSARTFTYSCVCSGDTIPDLKTNYWAFFKAITGQGSKQLYDDVLDMVCYVYYEKQSNLGIILPNNEGGYSITFDIQFGETDPTQNIPNVYLVDGQNRFLVP